MVLSKAFNFLEHYRTSLLFILLAAVWGTSFIAIKGGLEFFPPILFAAFRYDLAGVLVLGIALAIRDQWRPRTRAEWGLVTLGGTLLIGVHFSLLFVGQQYVSSAIAAILLSLLPVLTPVFAWFLLPNERLDWISGVGVLCGLFGVVIIAQPDPAQLDASALGVLLIFLSAATFAFGTVLTQRIDAHLPVVTMQAWMMLIGSGILHAISFGMGESPSTVAWTPSAVISLTYLAVIAGAGGFLIYFHLLDQLGPVELNLVNYLVPVFAALVGWILLGEGISATSLAGFFVIATGFAVLKRAQLSARVRSLARRTPHARRTEQRFSQEAD